MQLYSKLILNILILLLSTNAFADSENEKDKDNDDKYSCNLSIPSFNFPLISPLINSETRGIGSVVVTCQSLKGNGATPVKYSVKFSAGYSSNFYNRSMRSLTNKNKLSYNLFADSALTQVLGDGSSSTYTFRNQYTLKKGDPSRSDEFIIYGNVPPDSIATQGGYNDIISVWLEY